MDGYRLLSRLGSGGMADVYLADTPTGRPVAVKVLRANTGATEACRREYRIASTIDAKSTPPVLAYGTSEAGSYLVIAYLPGYRCATTLAGGPITPGRLWRFGSALARTLAAVHTRSVVHCDVKPSNLLVRDDDVRIIDFGIARHVGQHAHGGIVECSRGWAAPEQLWNTAATPAVDVFAWGCLLAQLASGIHPFASQSEQEWILRLQSAQPDLFDLPPGLDNLIRAALARNPRDRPTAHELTAICQHRVDNPAAGRPRDSSARQHLQTRSGDCHVNGSVSGKGRQKRTHTMGTSLAAHFTRREVQGNGPGAIPTPRPGSETWMERQRFNRPGRSGRF
ncbi:serine/threonine-protein kinase [Actinoplanes regularis]|uniref:Serine/threonine protein kinase n=1 Tax=Actinoplanes regularis TaxID=52697 RepID=A0A239H0S7_9ACTN|nr:serine/threonine-protein kinase [Actinoplanes regularis]GIE90942.1 hypothetical protein Are01nite_74220 [Actinoplanes regularis]SNS73884.1 Serine/threonine protein kinase [Actinoplanes regularis]